MKSEVIKLFVNTKIGETPNFTNKEIVCDTLSDLNSISEAIEFGSIAYVIEDEERYIYGSNGWVLYKGIVFQE